MSTRQSHPDYEAAPAARRYTGGSLRGLFTFLTFESKDRPGRDCWRILPGGAVVSMRRTEDDRRILRIARSKAPTTSAHWDAWRRECDTFVEKFVEPIGWRRVNDEAATGVAVEFHEAEP